MENKHIAKLPDQTIPAESNQPVMAKRFRGFLPIIIDVETGGFNAKTDALLEIAAVILKMDDNGHVFPHATHAYHVAPFPDANLEPEALAFTGIDPYHPLRPAVQEHDALNMIFNPIRKSVKTNNCTRAILVGHNASFDLGFLNAAVERCQIKRNPFHPFSSFDTATLGGVFLGQTVLARAMDAAGLEWDNNRAHSAKYDAERTAELFCLIANKWNNSSA